jgi:hypothetical protein
MLAESFISRWFLFPGEDWYPQLRPGTLLVFSVCCCDKWLGHFPFFYLIIQCPSVDGGWFKRWLTWRRTKCYHSLGNGWNWRTSFWVRLAWPKRPKIVCSPSYVDIRSGANITRGFDYEHMIKARAHKGGVRIGKTPKKLASICCP